MPMYIHTVILPVAALRSEFASLVLHSAQVAYLVAGYWYQVVTGCQVPLLPGTRYGYVTVLLLNGRLIRLHSSMIAKADEDEEQENKDPALSTGMYFLNLVLLDSYR